MADPCVVAQRELSLGPRSVHAIRTYVSDVYPHADVTSLSDSDLVNFFTSRQWFYGGMSSASSSSVSKSAKGKGISLNGPSSGDDERRSENIGHGHGHHKPKSLPQSLLSQLSLITSSTYRCVDGFFGSGLLHRDNNARFPGVLPCTPGTDCVRRQNAFMPTCTQALAALREDVWLEVWHLSFDGRAVSPSRRPKGWSELLDHGPAGWWYIHAPGSGIYYHAGRTLAAPSKASLLRRLMDEWIAHPEGHYYHERGGGGGGAAEGSQHRAKAAAARTRAFSAAGRGASSALDVEPKLRRLIRQATGSHAHELAANFSKLEAGVPCKSVGWGRWRCVGDFVPSDNWDALLIALGRALRYDSLMLTATMWGRALGSYARLLALAQGRPPPDEPPPPMLTDGELSAEVVDLRLPPPPFNGGSAVLNDPGGAAREAMAHEWVAHLLASTPPRLSLRDPFRLSDESRASRCAFNASGGPTVRLACAGHVSWGVRNETQRQQTCTRAKQPYAP